MKIYKNLRSIIYDKRISLLHNEDGISELVHLQEKKVGKKQFTVEAPTSGEVTTDDLADVLANAINIAIENELESAPAQISRASVSGGSAGARMTSIAFSGARRSNTSHVASFSSGGSYIDRMLAARKLGYRR
jgi:hypothetical protein